MKLYNEGRVAIRALGNYSAGKLWPPSLWDLGNLDLGRHPRARKTMAEQKDLQYLAGKEEVI